MLLAVFWGCAHGVPRSFFFFSIFFPRNFKLNCFNLTICKLKSLVTGDFCCFFCDFSSGVNLGSTSGCRRFCSCLNVYLHGLVYTDLLVLWSWIAPAMAVGHGLDHSFFAIATRWGHIFMDSWKPASGMKWSHLMNLDFKKYGSFCLHLFIDNRFKSSNYSAQRPFLLATWMTSYICVLWGAFQFLGQPWGQPSH